MIETEIQEPQVPYANYAEAKAAAKAARNQSSTETAAEPKLEVTEKDQSEPKGKTTEITDASESPATTEKSEVKTAEPTGSQKQESQEQEEHTRRNRTAEGRIAELTAAEKREKERADNLQKELETLRKSSAAPVVPKAEVKTEVQVEAPKPAEFKRQDFTDPKPKLKDLEAKALAEAKAGTGSLANLTFAELQDLWSEQVDEWREKKQKHDAAQATEEEAFKKTETARVAQVQTAEQRARRKQDSISAAKVKYPDMDLVVQRAAYFHPETNTGFTDAMDRVPNAGELIYALAKNDGAEYARVAALPPDEAFDECMAMSRDLRKAQGGGIASAEQPKPVEKSPAAPAKETVVATPPTPEKPKPSISRAPEPYKPVGGTDVSAKAVPQNYKEWKKAAKHGRR